MGLSLTVFAVDRPLFLSVRRACVARALETFQRRTAQGAQSPDSASDQELPATPATWWDGMADG